MAKQTILSKFSYKFTVLREKTHNCEISVVLKNVNETFKVIVILYLDNEVLDAIVGEEIEYSKARKYYFECIQESSIRKLTMQF